MRKTICARSYNTAFTHLQPRVKSICLKLLACAVALCFLIQIYPTGAKAEVPPFDGSKYNVESYMLVDAQTGQVLAEKNPDVRIYPSSTTKLMTALLLLETKGLSGETTVGGEVNFSAGSSLMHILPGETLTINDLFHGMMICSGNDAAAALAVYMGGDIDTFVQTMNMRAQQLGMTGTHFVNPHGLFLNANPDIAEKDWGINHYTTAADMAKLAVECAKYPELMEVVKKKTYQLSPTNKHSYVGTKENGDPLGMIEQSNRLLYTTQTASKKGYEKYLYENATGMKTGLVANIKPGDEWIKNYGCLVASAEKDGLDLIAVMFGDQSTDAVDRWDLAKALFEYGFNNFANADLSQYIKPVSLTEQVTGYAKNDPQQGMLSITSNMISKPPGKELVDKSVADGLKDGSLRVEQDIRFTKPFVAPISSGEEMGTVAYMLNGKEIYSAPLIAGRQIYPTGEEKATSSTYNLPEDTSKNLWLWLIIPACGVGGLLIIRAAATAITHVKRANSRHSAYYRRQRSSPKGRYYDPGEFSSRNGRRKL